MIKLLRKFQQAIFDPNQYIFEQRQREIEEYLAKSVDRYDLERRERDLAKRGYF